MERRSRSLQRGDRNAVTAEKLANAENRPLTIHVPDACPEGQQFCENSLGLRDGGIGVIHHLERISFSIEEVDDLGCFRLAAYPDCKRDERLAAIADNAAEPYDGDLEILPYTDVRTGEEDIVEGEAPPLLGEGSEEVTAPPNDGIGSRELVREALQSSPYEECGRLVVPAATLGDPVELADPSTVDEQGWWQIHLVEGERPMFVETSDCPDGQCQIGLVLNEEAMLIAAGRDEVIRLRREGMRMSFWGSVTNTFNDVAGSVEDSFNSGLSTLSEATATIGTVTQVDNLGGKDLHISAATPGARLFDAVAQEGPQALSGRGYRTDFGGRRGDPVGSVDPDRRTALRRGALDLSGFWRADGR